MYERTIEYVRIVGAMGVADTGLDVGLCPFTLTAFNIIVYSVPLTSGVVPLVDNVVIRTGLAV